MTLIERILCPIDFSDVSLAALEQATGLARRYRSRLNVLHVAPASAAPLPMPAPVAATALPLLPGEQASRSRSATWRRLEAATETARRSGVDLETVLIEGDPVHRILDHALHLEAELIVMGTHGVGGLARLVAGSAAESVLRRARCPVLTVAPPAHGPSKDMLPAVRYERILCPIDFSATSLRALEYALALAQDSHAQVTLLHVPRRSIPGSARQQRARLERAERRLERLLPANARDFCVPRVIARPGKPDEEILRAANEQNARLVVIGARDRNALQRLVGLGATTDKVVRGASSPVLSVRSLAA